MTAMPLRFGRSKWPRLAAITLLAMTAAPGCRIDDSGANRARTPAPAPTASVPDAGGPLRRESAAKTLNEADPQPPSAADENVLQVAPANNQRTTAPPVR